MRHFASKAVRIGSSKHVGVTVSLFSPLEHGVQLLFTEWLHKGELVFAETFDFLLDVLDCFARFPASLHEIQCSPMPATNPQHTLVDSVALATFPFFAQKVEPVPRVNPVAGEVQKPDVVLRCF